MPRSPLNICLCAAEKYRYISVPHVFTILDSPPSLDPFRFPIPQVWWGRVVADGAEILVNPRSARAEAASGLVGRARWCMVDRENVDAIENSSDRMWVS